MKDIRNILASKTKQALTSNLLNADAIRQNIVILAELQAFIPPLLEEEYKQLEKNILLHGCQTPLQVWQTPKKNLQLDYTDPDELAYVLIDGHNRHRICIQHNRPFEVYILSFASMKEAKDYMIDLQLGRRNLSGSQASYLRGLRYNNEKNDKNSNLKAISPKGQNDPSVISTVEDHEITELEMAILPKGQNDPSGVSTADRLAKEYNVSPKTIKRDAEFAKGLDKLTPDLRQSILSGQTKVDKNVIRKLSKQQTLPNLIADLTSVADLVEQEGNSAESSKEVLMTQHANLIVEQSKRFLKNKDKASLESLISLAQEAINMLE
jgi:hypothetical protein